MPGFRWTSVLMESREQKPQEEQLCSRHISPGEPRSSGGRLGLRLCSPPHTLRDVLHSCPLCDFPCCFQCAEGFPVLLGHFSWSQGQCHWSWVNGKFLSDKWEVSGRSVCQCNSAFTWAMAGAADVAQQSTSSMDEVFHLSPTSPSPSPFPPKCFTAYLLRKSRKFRKTKFRRINLFFLDFFFLTM